jgi:hypothetical protein
MPLRKKPDSESENRLSSDEQPSSSDWEDDERGPRGATKKKKGRSSSGGGDPGPAPAAAPPNLPTDQEVDAMFDCLYAGALRAGGGGGGGGRAGPAGATAATPAPPGARLTEPVLARAVRAAAGSAPDEALLLEMLSVAAVSLGGDADCYAGLTAAQFRAFVPTLMQAGAGRRRQGGGGGGGGDGGGGRGRR